MLTEALVQKAITFLRGRIRRTPVELSPPLSAIVGVPVWLKLEFLQITVRSSYAAPSSES